MEEPLDHHHHHHHHHQQQGDLAGENLPAAASKKERKRRRSVLKRLFGKRKHGGVAKRKDTADTTNDEVETPNESLEETIRCGHRSDGTRRIRTSFSFESDFNAIPTSEPEVSLELAAIMMKGDGDDDEDSSGVSGQGTPPQMKYAVSSLTMASSVSSSWDDSVSGFFRKLFYPSCMEEIADDGSTITEMTVQTASQLDHQPSPTESDRRSSFSSAGTDATALTTNKKKKNKKKRSRKQQRPKYRASASFAPSPVEQHFRVALYESVKIDLLLVALAVVKDIVGQLFVLVWILVLPPKIVFPIYRKVYFYFREIFDALCEYGKVPLQCHVPLDGFRRWIRADEERRLIQQEKNDRRKRRK